MKRTKRGGLVLATLASLGAVATGCGGGGGGVTTGAKLVEIVTVAVPSGTTGVPYAATFAANFPNDPGAFFVVGGALPSGLSLDTATGELSGFPREVGRFSFVVAARDGADRDLLPGRDASFAEDRQTFALVVDRGAPNILPQVIPAAQYRASFSYQIDVAGGTPPYVFSMTGGELPSGLTVSTSGLLGVFPTAAAQHPYHFQVTVTDANGLVDIADLTVDVVVLPLGIETPPTLPDASEGFPYDVPLTLSSTGGGAPYAWSQVTPSGTETALSALNLQITSTGHIASLTPAGPPTAGNYAFTIAVTDEASQTAMRSFTLKVRSSPVIHAISPKVALAVGPFTVTGLKFQLGAQLIFNPGGSGAFTMTPTWVSGTTLQFATAPALGVSGPVTVRVVNPDGGFYDFANGMLYAATSISFGTKGFIPSGISSFGLDAADLNGDGLAEIVHSGSSGFRSFSTYALVSGSGGVHLFRNLGGLAFSQTTLTSSNMSDVKFADLDADGDKDIVAVGASQIVTWINDGAGNMSAGPTSTTPALVGAPTAYVAEMSLGFINNDSFPDLVYASGYALTAGQVYAALNTGTGAFTVTASQTSGMNGSFRGVTSLAMVKIDGGDVWDVAAGAAYDTSGGGAFRTSTMTTGGAFQAWSAVGAGLPTWGGTSAIRAGNFLNQTGPCVVVSTTLDPPDSGGVGGGTLRVYYGSGLTSSTTLSIPAGLTKSIGVGDFDFDGIDDFAVSAKVAVAGTTNNPTTGTPGLVYVYKGSNGLQATSLNLMNGTPTITLAQSGRVASGDLDGDGRPDLLVSTSFWATDNQQSPTWQRGDSCDGNPLGIVYYLNSSN